MKIRDSLIDTTNSQYDQHNKKNCNQASTKYIQNTLKIFTHNFNTL